MGGGASKSDWNANRGGEFRRVLTAKGGREAPVRLVDALFLIKLEEGGGRLAHRQALPEEAFLSLAALEKMNLGPGGALRIVVVSYPWLQPDHPDPHGQTLQLLARVLRAYVKEGGGACGVFLDFCSLHQKGAGGEPRTKAEAKLFNTALGCLSDWYSHPKTLVLKLTKMPEGYPNGFTFAPGTSPNTADYYGRGWCFKESSVANLVKDFDFCLDLGRLGAETEGWRAIRSECQAGRAAPLTPEDFFTQLEQKSFTSKKADLPTVGGLYKAAFTKRFGEAKELIYAGLGWGDAEMVLLCKVLSSGSLAKMETLRLDSNQIADEGMKAFSTAIASGSLGSLTLLRLDENQIGDGGMKAFSDAIASGSLAKLENLWLQGNQIGDDGMKAFSSAIASGSLGSLKELWLSTNKIGDAGLAAFSKAIASGSLAKLEKVVVDTRHERHPQLVAACKPRNITIV